MNLTRKEREALEWIQPDEVIEFLQALIQQPSDYPPGDCRGAVNVVSEKLAQVGIIPEYFYRQEHQPNLLATYPQIGKSPRLMFHGHIDTVPAGDRKDWRFGPFSGAISEGHIYGRGAGDDKGSVAVQVMALVALARTGLSFDRSLQVVVVSDEESGALQGTKWLHQEGMLSPEALVVGEQTNNQIAIAERVACGIDLTVFGKSTHGAMPWAGDNAILKTARVIQWLEDKLFPRLEAKSHPYLPPATLNIGKIQGGLQWNIVPDFCKIEMDRRLLPGETRDMAMDEIRLVLEAYAEEVEPLRYDLFTTGEVAANINTASDHPLVRLADQALLDITGEKRPLTGYVQTSDGRWFAKDGIPIIIFGPSDPSVGHSVNENVSIDQLIEATRFLTLLALRWLSSSSD